MGLADLFARRRRPALAESRSLQPVLEALESRLLLSVAMENQSVWIEVDDDGSFTMQRASDHKWLLYQSSSTTMFSVKVDDQVYTSAQSYDFAQVNGPVADSADTIHIDYVTPENVLIRHQFMLAGPAVQFKVTATNLDSLPHQVAVRYLLDTQVNNNDGSPLYADGVTDSQGSSVCTYEVDIPEVGFSEWRSYDVWPSPTLTATGTLGTIPDRMVFAYWPTASRTLWDYQPNPNQAFYTPGYTASPLSDSAVLMYFGLGDLAPGGQDFSITYYGIAQPEGVNDLDLVTAEVSRLASEARSDVQAGFHRFADDFGTAMVALRNAGAVDLAHARAMALAAGWVSSNTITPAMAGAVQELSEQTGISPQAAMMILDQAGMYNADAGLAMMGPAGVGLLSAGLPQIMSNWLDALPQTSVADLDGDGDSDNLDWILSPTTDAAQIGDQFY